MFNPSNMYVSLYVMRKRVCALRGPHFSNARPYPIFTDFKCFIVRKCGTLAECVGETYAEVRRAQPESGRE